MPKKSIFKKEDKRGMSLNSEKKVRREQQLAKKAEAIEAYANEVVVIDDVRVEIDGSPYDLVENFHDGFIVEKVGERFSQILTKYDYIVGDWGYDQLRMRGFYAEDSQKGLPYQNISRLQDYLNEYCNFGCAYFVLHNLEVQPPEPIPAKIRKKSSKKKSQDKRNKKKNNAFISEKKYNVRNKKKTNKKNVKLRNANKKQNPNQRHFTIRQK